MPPTERISPTYPHITEPESLPFYELWTGIAKFLINPNQPEEVARALQQLEEECREIVHKKIGVPYKRVPYEEEIESERDTKFARKFMQRAENIRQEMELARTKALYERIEELKKKAEAAEGAEEKREYYDEIIRIGDSLDKRGGENLSK